MTLPAEDELHIRAAKLLDVLGAWFDADELKPPYYVQHQMDELRAVLAEGDSNG